MIFFPYKVDLNLTRFPAWTILIILLCIVVHARQQESHTKLINFAHTFCTEERPRAFWLAMDRLAGTATPAACAQTMFAIHNNENHAAEIERWVNEARPYDTVSLAAGRRRNMEILQETYSTFKARIPHDLTRKLVYDPRSFNVKGMITAPFAHADWRHLIGNLFFFFAFAATVEAIMGFIFFPLVILALCIGTNVAYSLWTLGIGSTVPTLGLSGVVMGMMGLFTFFLPTAGIRCFVWVLIWLRTLIVPAWLIMAWFVGWDLYSLSHDDGSAGVNFMAHVSGAFLGLLVGMIFLRRRREAVQRDFQLVSTR